MSLIAIRVVLKSMDYLEPGTSVGLARCRTLQHCAAHSSSADGKQNQVFGRVQLVGQAL